jgi:hypothetical protein
MYDIDCLDYGPYTPSETSLKSSSKAEEMDSGSGNGESVLSSRHSSPRAGSLSGLGSDYLSDTKQVVSGSGHAVDSGSSWIHL